MLYSYNHLITNIPSHTIRRAFLSSVMNIEIGEGAAVLLGVRFYCRGRISIGANSVIDRDCVLDGRGGIWIGSNVNLAPEVIVLTSSHDPGDGSSFSAYERAVAIEDYGWVATRAVILPGVRIRKGGVVGAGAVVTRDVEEGVVVAGNPSAANQ